MGAAEFVGMDGKGYGGVQGYLIRLAITKPVTFGGLLGKLLPLDINATVTTDIDFSRLTTEEIATMERLVSKSAVSVAQPQKFEQPLLQHDQEYEKRVKPLLEENLINVDNVEVVDEK